MRRLTESMGTLKQFLDTVIPRVIFNATLHAYTLRLLLISSVGCICGAIIFLQHYLPEWKYFIAVFCVSPAIIIHQVLSVFPIMPVYLDMLVALGEIITSSCFVQPWTWYFDQYDITSTITLCICIYAQAISLVALFLIRVLALIRRSSDWGFIVAFTESFDFLSMSTMCPERARRVSRLSLVTGRTIFRHVFQDESMTIVLMRGVSAVAMILVLLAFAVTTVILEPVHEAGLTPSKRYSTLVVHDNLRLQSDSNWRILVFVQIDEYTDQDVASGFLDDNMQNFQDAVDVIPLWTGLYSGPDCNGTRKYWSRLESISAWVALTPRIAGIEIDCPNRLARSAKQQTMNDLIDYPSNDIWPDLFVRVNFSALHPIGSFDDFHYDNNARSRTVYVAVGLTADVNAILANTVPIPLVSNVHLMGAVQTTIRQQLPEDNIAASLFGTAANFLVAQIPYLIPDPLSSSSNDDTATLQLYMQADYRNWSFDADYREKSIWAGLSALGGFWTLLNGFFILLFGVSLLKIVFDVKPLSTFGLLHRFRGVQLDEYPEVSTEGETTRGLIAFLREHFIDLSRVRPVSSVPARGDHELGILCSNESSALVDSNGTSGVGAKGRE